MSVDVASPWSQMPDSPHRDRLVHRVTRTQGWNAFLFLATCSAVPIASIAAQDATDSRVLLVSMTCLALAGATMATARRSKWWAPYVLVLAAAPVFRQLIDGRTAVASILIAWTATRTMLDCRPTTWRQISPRDARLVTGLAIGGGFVTWQNGSTAAIVVGTVVAATGALVVRAPAVEDRIRRSTKTAGYVLSRCLTQVSMFIAGIVVIVIPWAFQRIFRWDPTWVPRPDRSRFVHVRGSSHEADRPWEPDPRTTRSSATRALHRIGILLSVVVIALVSVGITAWIAQVRSERQRYSAPALATERWWPAMSDAIDIAYGTSPISSYTGVMMRDAHFPGFNVTDRRRMTWTPPKDECRPIRVWMFGGSTLFGLGQRDEHTIASDLARLAWQDGIPLEVSNWGVPADTSWLESRRLELALVEGRPRPDLVVFYDGANDYRAQVVMNATGRGGRLPFASDLDWKAIPDIEARNRRLASLMEILRDGPEMPPIKATHQSPAEVGSFAALGYNATDRASRMLLEQSGVPMFRFYQPVRSTRATPLRTEPVSDAANEEYLSQVERSFRAALGPGIIDISNAMDATRQPVYYDEMHTNELGARIVADAMYRYLRPQLEASRGQLGPCRS